MLEVADTGQGIPADDLPRIFNPFFTTRVDQGGTGLGLATVHGILRQSGGYLTVESRPGEGTCFRLYLPRVEEAAPETARLPDPAPIAAAGPILLVEDEEPLRRLAERTLRRKGYEVAVAEDAESALALLDAGLVPGLLVSDVAMPGMDGVALARAIRQNLPGLPVLLVSGYANALVEAELGGESIRFLAKPYAPADLAAAVAAEFAMA
jgi:two-component system cell cycle sensor histidine kinase/response regulator CckA